jgi:DNA polymerase
VFGCAEAPGFHEDRIGRPFVGDAGQELDKLYLPLAGLDRREVYITNAMKCRPPNNRKPTVREVRSCSSHFLPHELAKVTPEIVLLMGATACSLVPSINLERDHGIPLRGELFGVEYTLFPTFHPAAGLRGVKIGSVNVMTYLLEDFERLGSLLKGALRPQIDRWGHPKTQVLTEPAQVNHALTRGLITPDLAIDTESHDGRVWSVQFSTNPRESYFLRATSVGACRELGRHVKHFRVVLHNAIADLDPLESLGIYLGSREFSAEFSAKSVPKSVSKTLKINYVDSMHLAYHTARLPQGLKALAWRLLGARMRDYNDVVTPWSRQAFLDWIWDNAWKLRKLNEVSGSLRELAEVSKSNKTKPPKIVTKSNKTKPPKIVTKFAEVSTKFPHTSQKLNSRRSAESSALKRLYRNTAKTQGEKPYDPWERWEELPGDVQRRIVDVVGPPPRPGIAHVPFDEAVSYACDDAAKTLLVCWELEKKLESFGAEVVVGDYAA